MKAITTASKDPSANGSSAASPTRSGKSRGPRATIPLGSIQANDQCPRRRLVKVREQRSHPTAQIENPPGLLKRKLVEQPSGQAHEDGGPQVAIGLGLGAVVAGDAETGFWSSVGWWGRLHAGKRTLPRAPGVSPTASHREGCSTQVASGPPTPSDPGADHSWTESLPACLMRAALRPGRNREAATTGGR